MLSAICNAQKESSKENSLELRKSTNYKTGDIPNCLKFIPSMIDQKMDNLLKITNDSNKEAVVKLIKLDSLNGIEVTARVSFIEKDSVYEMRNIPSGKYYIKIAYGTEWVEKINANKSCSCRFSLNSEYEKGKNLNFTLIKIQSGIETPNYELTLNPSYSKQTPNDLYYHDFEEEILVDSNEDLKVKK